MGRIYSVGLFVIGACFSSEAAANSCCILGADKGDVCVNAGELTCKAHPRFVTFVPGQVCTTPNKLGQTTCKNAPEEEAAKLIEKQFELTIEVMGKEYSEKLRSELEGMVSKARE